MNSKKLSEWFVNKKSITLFLITSNLIVTYFFKYFHNSIIPLDFSIYNIGNLYNFLITLSAVGGILLVYITRQDIVLERMIFFISIVQLVFLLAAILFNQFNFFLLKYYILGYPAKKIIVSTLLTINGFILLYLNLIVWSKLLKLGGQVYFKALFLSVIVLISMLLFTFLFTLNFDNDKVPKDEKFEIAVVLGAAVWSDNKPSPLFAGRIKKAITAYKKGQIDKIQVTGGNAPGEISEAEAAKRMLIKNGVHEEDILKEESTATTSEQVRYIRNELTNSGKVDKVLIVSDKFHLTRVIEICNFYGVKASVLPTEVDLNWERYLYYHLRESMGLMLFWMYAV